MRTRSVFHCGPRNEKQTRTLTDAEDCCEDVCIVLICGWSVDVSCQHCGYFETQRRVQFEGCAAEPLRTITVILPGSKWSCLLLRNVAALVKGRNKEVAEMAKKVMKKLKEEVERKRLQSVSSRKWEGREKQGDCFMWFVGK